MKKNLFGTLGQYIKGNAVIIILAIATIAAGALSFNTIKDINNRLDSQSFENPDKVVQPPESETEQAEEAQDVQNEANNVPLKPKVTAKPKTTAAPQSESEETATEAEGVEKPDGDTENADKFILPIDNKIVAAFSDDELVYNITMGDWRTHNGIDIKATRDTAVKACCDGVVDKVYNDGMLGWVVEIKTDDFATRYCGLAEKVFVKQGDKVKQGDTLGTVGEIPLETASDSHLHLEIIKNGQYQNPDEYLKK